MNAPPVLRVVLRCRHGMTPVERCYDNIDVIETEPESSSQLMSHPLYADLVIDAFTCVLLRDVSLLRDTQQSQQLALSVSSLATKYLRCCVIAAPLNDNSRSVCSSGGRQVGP